MSCLPELWVSRQYDDLLTTRPFDSSSGSHLFKLFLNISDYMKFDIFLSEINKSYSFFDFSTSAGVSNISVVFLSL